MNAHASRTRPHQTARPLDHAAQAELVMLVLRRAWRPFASRGVLRMWISHLGAIAWLASSVAMVLGETLGYDAAEPDFWAWWPVDPRVCPRPPACVFVSPILGAGTAALARAGGGRPIGWVWATFV